MFGISGIELAIIIVVAFLIFGPDKLPGVIKNVSHIWEVLKSLRQQADQVIKAEVVEPLKDIEASVNPFVEEGKSATDMLAKRLGIKPDNPKKDEAKTSETKAEDSKVKAAEALATEATGKAAETADSSMAGAATAAAAAAATAAAAAATTEDSSTKADPAPTPKKKPKTESFAEKKAALELAYLEQQKAEKESAEPVATPSQKDTKTPAEDETAGE